MFKSWFSSTNGSTSATFQDLQLTKMNDIFTNLILNKQLSSTTNSVEQETTSNAKFVQDSIQQTISTAEEMAQSYQQKSNQEKQKILNNQEKFKKPPTVNSIITAIENRQINMVQRAQHNINQQLKSIFQMNVSDHNPKY
jgi:DNA-binding transcriptional regulator YbjK